MKALRLTRWGKPAELVDVSVPKPEPGQIVIQVTASGACHSDLHLMEWPEGRLPWKLPFTIGHENAGTVHEIGAGVEGIRVGESVLVYGPWGCGRCRECRLGRENYCEEGATRPGGGGLGLDGGMAEYMLVPSSRLLVPIGSLDPVGVAPLADAGLTPYHAIKPSLTSLVPGSSAVVIGVGGLGQTAVQLLHLLTAARIIAVDKETSRLESARETGADETVRSHPDAAEEIRSLTANHGAELVLDMVGSDDTLALGARILRTEGRLVVVGLAMGTLPFHFFSVPYGAQVSTSYWGTVTELMELVSLAATGRLHVRVETFPLSRAGEAYDRLRRGLVKTRAVVVPD